MAPYNRKPACGLCGLQAGFIGLTGVILGDYRVQGYGVQVVPRVWYVGLGFGSEGLVFVFVPVGSVGSFGLGGLGPYNLSPKP